MQCFFILYISTVHNHYLQFLWGFSVICFYIRWVFFICVLGGVFWFCLFVIVLGGFCGGGGGGGLKRDCIFEPTKVNTTIEIFNQG